MFLIYIFKDLNIALFAKLRSKSVRPYLIEFGLTFIASLFVIILDFEISAYLDVSYTKGTTEYYNEVGTRILNEKFIMFNFGLGVIISIQWIRVFMIFQASRTFGKMVEIILNMITDIGKFMVLLIILVIAFSSSGRILFFDVAKFKSDTESIIYLISAALGNFDYAIFDTSGLMLSKYYGYLYQTLFLVMVAITLLNFLVAILADTYTILQSNAKGLHS